MTANNTPASPRTDSVSHRGEPGSQPSLRCFRIYTKQGTQPIPSHLVAEVRFPPASDPETLGIIRWIDPEARHRLDWLVAKLDPPTYSQIYNLIRRSNGITWLVIGYWDP